MSVPSAVTCRPAERARTAGTSTICTETKHSGVIVGNIGNLIKERDRWTEDDRRAVDYLRAYRVPQLSNQERQFVCSTLANMRVGQVISMKQRAWFEAIWSKRGPGKRVVKDE